MQLENLKQKLLERKYPVEVVDEKFKLAKKKERRNQIFANRSRKQSDNKVRLIFTHNKVNPPVHVWMRQCKKLLARNDEAKAIGSRIQISSRQPKNLLRIAAGYKDGQVVTKKNSR